MAAVAAVRRRLPMPVNNTQPVQVNLTHQQQYRRSPPASPSVRPDRRAVRRFLNVVIDTGSTGLRLITSQVTLSLPQVSDGHETGWETVLSLRTTPTCGAAGHGRRAMAGEKAASVPIQLWVIPVFQPRLVIATAAAPPTIPSTRSVRTAFWELESFARIAAPSALPPHRATCISVAPAAVVYPRRHRWPANCRIRSGCFRRTTTGS